MSIVKACAKPAKVPTPQHALPAKKVSPSTRQTASDAMTPTAKSAPSPQLFVKNVAKVFTWKTTPAGLVWDKTASSATVKENVRSAALVLA